MTVEPGGREITSSNNNNCHNKIKYIPLSASLAAVKRVTAAAAAAGAAGARCSGSGGADSSNVAKDNYDGNPFSHFGSISH